MSRESFDCLKPGRDICVKTIIPSRIRVGINAAFLAEGGFGLTKTTRKSQVGLSYFYATICKIAPKKKRPRAGQTIVQVSGGKIVQYLM